MLLCMFSKEYLLGYITIGTRLDLLKVDSNVLCVDWENGAGLPNYVKASVNTRLVGKQLGLFIQVLGRHLNYTADRFHIIGFSLGAHVSGFAGTHLQEMEGQNLTRITGM